MIVATVKCSASLADRLLGDYPHKPAEEFFNAREDRYPFLLVKSPGRFFRTWRVDHELAREIRK